MRVIMMSHLVRQIIGYSSLLATFFVDPHARTAGANFCLDRFRTLPMRGAKLGLSVGPGDDRPAE